MATLAIMGHAAVVSQLVGNAFGLMARIKRAVETARQNKLECDRIARRVPAINDVLSGLPQEPEVEPPLQELNNTLQEAHDMVVACRDRSSANLFFRSRNQAECFTQVNLRIMSDLSVLNLCLLNIIARRQITTMAMVPSSESFSAYPQTQMAVVLVPNFSRIFRSAEIAVATNNFAVELARGSSGRVFKGRLHDGLEVAVKVLHKHGLQDKEDAFVTELEILFPLRHNHIVRLVGWCAEYDDRMFVYEHEHMRKGTLRDNLLRERGGSSSSPVTTSWRARVEVLLGVTRAIQHLHHRGIIHRDVSSSNILLDASWGPRLSGFGSAVLLFQAAGRGHGGHPVEVVGRQGYIDPEYESTGLVSPASDVYSFGVVMLEALTGRPPVRLVKSVLRFMNEKLQDVLDGHPALQLTTTPRKLQALDLVAHTARRCLWPHGEDRPPMQEVVDNLEKALRIIRSDERLI